MATPLLASAGDIEAGKAESAPCARCHGVTGISNASIYPNLKGQHEAYLISSLKAYRASQRQGGMSSIMTSQAESLNNTDIENLAAYYSSLK